MFAHACSEHMNSGCWLFFSPSNFESFRSLVVPRGFIVLFFFSHPFSISLSLLPDCIFTQLSQKISKTVSTFGRTFPEKTNRFAKLSEKKTSNDIVAGNGRIIKVYLFVMWLYILFWRYQVTFIFHASMIIFEIMC